MVMVTQHDTQYYRIVHLKWFKWQIFCYAYFTTIKKFPFLKNFIYKYREWLQFADPQSRVFYNTVVTHDS